MPRRKPMKKCIIKLMEVGYSKKKATSKCKRQKDKK